MSEVKEVGNRELSRDELLRCLMVAEENERRRIARELHDHSGQLLAALSHRLCSLASRDDIAAIASDELSQLQILVDEVSHELHNVALELRPATLDDLGLDTALHQYIRLWSARSKTRVDLLVRGMEDRLPSHLEAAIYRIVQEALTNIAKHAHAKHVSVIVHQGRDQLSVIIEDDGVGFDVESLRDRSADEGRLGLLGMEERLAAFGGTLGIEAALTRGTTLYVRLPLPLL